MSGNNTTNTIKGCIYKGIFLSLMVFCGSVGFTREYTATNYLRANGFPGNKVYCLHQDSHGYIWAGTENGLVSFNGYEFKTYTTKDGLPANEVIGIKEDRFGKLWLVTFSNEVCHFWKGKIHRSGNDTLLRKLKFNSVIRDIRFDSSGNTWFLDYTGVTRINPQQEITRIDKINNDLLFPAAYLTIRDTGKLTILNGPKVYQYNEGRFRQLALPSGDIDVPRDYTGRLLWIRAEELECLSIEQFIALQTSNNKLYFKKEELPYVTFFDIISPDLLIATVNDYTYLIDVRTGERLDHFLKDCRVSACLVTKDGSLWFATIGKGLFHYVPTFIKSIPIRPGSSLIMFIKAAEDEVYFIKAPYTLVRLKPDASNQYKIMQEFALNTGHDLSFCYYVNKYDDGCWISCGRDVSRFGSPGNSPIKKFDLSQCKTAIEEDREHLLIGTVWGLYRFSKNKFVVTDTLYDKRVTCLAKMNNTIYAGTLDGLLAFNANKKTADPLKCFVTKGPITAIASDADSLLWIAATTSLRGFCKNRMVGNIDENYGLMCNSISAIKISGQFLWVGTDNGLYAFNKKAPFSIVRHLSTADGLNSNQVTYIEAANGLIWAGTDNGLNYFAEKEITRPNIKPRFIVTGIQSEGNAIQQTDGAMELKSGPLQIDFDAIDHSGISKPVFSYRIDSGQWANVSDNNLYFPTAPFGDFTVQIRARSPHWGTPQVIKLSFHRPYPYYLSGWFIATTELLIILSISGLVILLIRRLRKKDEKKLMVQLNLLELEQMALQGQMNPHFIFNSIASIKEHYNSGDIPRANKLLDAFTALIRATFEMSSQTFTTLDKELKYLNQYLSIEQERFNNSFGFSINKKTLVAASMIPVPSMLLQPLVENAIRHGIRHLPDGIGVIVIDVVQQQGTINISIADNGVGRAYSQEIKNKQHFHNPVTSTAVNHKRIHILSKLFDQKISVHTEDLKDAENRAAGTIVSITYPLNIHTVEQ